MLHDASFNKINPFITLETHEQPQVFGQPRCLLRLLSQVSRRVSSPKWRSLEWRFFSTMIPEVCCHTNLQTSVDAAAAALSLTLAKPYQYVSSFSCYPMCICKKKQLHLVISCYIYIIVIYLYSYIYIYIQLYLVIYLVHPCRVSGGSSAISAFLLRKIKLSVQVRHRISMTAARCQADVSQLGGLEKWWFYGGSIWIYGRNYGRIWKIYNYSSLIIWWVYGRYVEVLKQKIYKQTYNLD